jgi:hypothetical protein
MSEPSKWAKAVANEWFKSYGGDTAGEQIARDMNRSLAEDIDRLAVQPAVAELEREIAELRAALAETEGRK